MEPLFVCLPGSNFSGKWLADWNELYSLLSQEYRVTCIYGEGNNIYDVRNECLATICEIAKSGIKPQYVLWIDSDNLVEYDGFSALRNALGNHPEASAIGAWYLMQMHHGEEPLLCAGTGNERPTMADMLRADGDLLPIEYIGFGFLLMRYSLLVDLGTRAFNPILRTDQDFETDDVSFCLRATRAGHKLFLHSGIHSPHLKLLPVPIAIRQRKNHETSLG